MIINGIKCTTQLDAVLQHMKKGKTIDQEQAYLEIGTQRLGDVIFRLRGLGYNIKNIQCKGNNRFGNNVSYVKYILVDTPEEQSMIETINTIANG
tara:strand:+ start:219 stop:503 length:285 start_codon:yes stop_codon:yes gene_type:complete